MNGTMFFKCVPDFLVSVALAEHCLETRGDKGGAEGVHSRGGSGTCGADNPSKRGRRRAAEVNEDAFDFKRQRQPFVNAIAKAFMGHIAGGVDSAGDKDFIACF